MDLALISTRHDHDALVEQIAKMRDVTIAKSLAGDGSDSSIFSAEWFLDEALRPLNVER